MSGEVRYDIYIYAGKRVIYGDDRMGSRKIAELVVDELPLSPSTNSILTDVLQDKPIILLCRTSNSTCREGVYHVISVFLEFYQLFLKSGYNMYCKIVASGTLDKPSTEYIKSLPEDKLGVLESIFSQILQTDDICIKTDSWFEITFSLMSTHPVYISTALLILRLLALLHEFDDSDRFLHDIYSLRNTIIENSTKIELLLGRYYGLDSDRLLLAMASIQVDLITTNTYACDGPASYTEANFSTDNWVDFLLILDTKKLNLYKQLNASHAIPHLEKALTFLKGDK